MDPSVEKEQIDMLVRWITALPWSMMCHLRAGEDIEKELKVYVVWGWLFLCAGGCCFWVVAAGGYFVKCVSYSHLMSSSPANTLHPPPPFLGKQQQDKLTEDELAYLVSTPHRPNTVLQTISSIIWNSSIPEDKKFRMDENLTVFADMLGASERILRTPLPVSYTR